MLTLVLGGTRSGKSRFAQSLCADAKRVAYIATARAEDDEMRARIARHRLDRPTDWVTVEEDLDIAGAAARCCSQCDFVVLDCLTIWLSNVCASRPDDSEDSLRDAATGEFFRFISAVANSQCVIVTN